MKEFKRKMIQELVVAQHQTQIPGRAPSETPREAHSDCGQTDNGKQR